MTGNAGVIKLIARDEALHLTATQHMINLLRNGQDDFSFMQIAHECQEEAIEIFRSAVEQEKEWAEYLFKDGSMIGLNKEIIWQYIEYIANIRMKAIGLPSLYPEATMNPIPWINQWLNSDNVQVAPQEQEISSYLIGQIDNDVNMNSLAEAEL